MKLLHRLWIGSNEQGCIIWKAMCIKENEQLSRRENPESADFHLFMIL